MSIDIYGKTAGGDAIMLRHDQPGAMNMSNANARALFAMLEIPFGDAGYGEATVPEIRRAIIKTRALFDRRAPHFIRETVVNDRIISCGIDEEYLARRLKDLSVAVEILAARNATTIYWA